MNYHLNSQGETRGIFPLEELSTRRHSGELDGTELVWCEGMTSWAPLDSVLRAAAGRTPGESMQPMPAKSRWNGPLLWLSIGAGVTLLVIAALAVALVLVRRARTAALTPPSQDPVQVVSRRVSWLTNTATEADVRARAREFRRRVYLESYRQHGPKDEPCRSQGLNYIDAWIARNYGGNAGTKALTGESSTDQLAAQGACKDPLLWTVLAANSQTTREWVQRLEEALEGFKTSNYPAYPKFFASVSLASQLSRDRSRVDALDRSSLEWFEEALRDGSVTAADQPELAQLLVSGWAKGFFHRHHSALYHIPEAASMPWLAHVLEGEHHIIEGWKARGGGYANTVSEKGWQGFSEHLAQARKTLTAAWELRPDWSLAPSRLINVSLGDSGLDEMRLWFDRAVAAQIDDEEAWSNLRWGLRPRWYGNEEAMLALGLAALDTKRFDTDVPRKYFDVVTDVEKESKLPLGQHLYDRSDLWPNLQRLYEGYLAEPSALPLRDGWRSTYSVVAYLAQRYDVARTQLEELHWKPWPGNLDGWGRDLSLFPLEVAARTSPVNGKIALAESARDRGAIAEALRLFRELKQADIKDENTRRFVEHRLASLALEEELEQGREVNLLPGKDGDLNWFSRCGEYRRLDDGAIEVPTAKGGHLFVSRVRVGRDFDVKGEFEVVRTAGPTFQLGLAMGLPESASYNWHAFVFGRNEDQEETAVFSRAWTGDQLVRPVKFEPARNTFRVRRQGGRLSAWLNGKEVFHESRPPRGIASRPNEFLLGLGAFNSADGAVVQYRKLQVQRLSPIRTRGTPGTSKEQDASGEE